MEHHGVSTDAGEIADLNVAENYRAGSHIDASTQNRRLRRLVDATDSERAILPYDAFVADDGRAMDDDPGLMFNYHAPSDGRGIWQFNPIVVSNAAEEIPVNDTEGRSQQLGRDRHSPDAKAVDRECPESGPAGIAPVSGEVFSD
ncbi:hypothetical protein [Sphingomonas sp.]|uniref:hypothetical protein n=1 Tax=Sphingomonas sp. TaxID=28214 RepID=UPI0038A1F17C